MSHRLNSLKGDYIGDILGIWKRKWKLLFGVQGLGSRV